MRRVLVTGGSMGIGLAVARTLASSGARLVLVARGAESLAQAAGSLDGEGHEWLAFDVSDEDAWNAVDTEDIDGLVCAAALMEPIGSIGDYPPSTFRRTLEVNVFGTLLAIHHCLPALRATSGAIVTFGGGGATAPLPRFDAYATSKAAVARLTENLAPVIFPVRINCVAPGFVATRLHEATLAAGPEAAGSDFYERTRRTIREGGFPAEEAAELVRFMLGDAECSGKLISAQWDPWREREFWERLADEPALATVRRIDGVLFDAVRERT